MFQIKDFASVSASLVNLMRSTTKKVSDFNIGSIVRSMLDAVAAEIEELYLQMAIGLREAIKVAVYTSFNFSAIGAAPATGLVRVTITSSALPVYIQNGTTFTVAGSSVTYTSTSPITISAGDTYGDVPVAANIAGTAGNLALNSVFTPSPPPTGFVSATNIAAFINGANAESDDQRQQRFVAFISSLNRGTVAALDYGLKTTVLYDANGNATERVASTSIVEPWLTDNTQPPSLVNCYIHNGVGATSSALVSQARSVIYGYYDASNNAIPGWKAAGVNVQVYAATELPLDIAGALTVAPGYDGPTVRTAASAAVSSYLLSLGIGVTFQLASLVEQLMSIDGVLNYVPSDYAPPAAPVLGNTAGGALGATTYYVVTTYVTANGETVVSAEASHAVPANNLLTVASPPVKTGVTGWNVYVGAASGAHTKQNAVPIAIGTAFAEPASGLIAGSAQPAVSTARLGDLMPSSSQKLMPGAITTS